MTSHQFRQLLVLVFCAVSIDSESYRFSRVAFAGGFGASPKTNKAQKKSRKKKTKGFGDLDISETKVEEPERKDEPVLDKWGLPPPTEEDIFPLMPPGTELIPVAENEQSSLRSIQEALKDHIDLRLDRFDEEGFERDSIGEVPMRITLIHKSPPVLAIENFFSDEQCKMVQEVAKQPPPESERATDAMQVDSATFSPMALSKRTSTSWFCHYAQMPTLLAKAHHVLGIPFEQMEEPQIVRYRTGEEFSWHYDEVPPTQLHNGGQRLATLLVYLNDVDRGGGTIFRDLEGPDGSELTMKPKLGSALLFFPAFRDGRPDDRTLHKGEVAMDEKWITQMWIHERKYSPVVPPGNSFEAAMPNVEQVCKTLGYQEHVS